MSSDKKLKLCEDIKKGVVCQNLEEITVLNVSDIFEILQRGIQQRQTAATLCNKNSSRSHSIFTMKIMIKECNVDGEEVVRHGQLNLVDLAGYVRHLFFSTSFSFLILFLLLVRSVWVDLVQRTTELVRLAASTRVC